MNLLVFSQSFFFKKTKIDLEEIKISKSIGNWIFWQKFDQQELQNP